MINIEELIKTSMKERQERAVIDTYRAIKAKILEFKTQKNAPVYDEASEVKLLQKMLKERQESANIYKTNGREDLANNELLQADVISKLIPQLPSESDIDKYIAQKYPNKIEQKEMGLVIKEVKSVFPMADGSIVAKVVKNYIKK
jgi:hypothetical protein